MKSKKRFSKNYDFLYGLNRRRNFAKQRGVYGAYYTGQLGKSVVGTTWKGEKVLRTYAEPANPNTVAQQSVRGKFKISQVVGSSILQTIIWPYWNPFANGQSGFNSFIGNNSIRVADNQDFPALLAAKGSYEDVHAVSAATYDTADGTVYVTFDGTVHTIGDLLDDIVLVAIDKTDYDPDVKTPTLLTYVDENSHRNDGNSSLTIKAGLNPADITVYVFAKQPSTDKVLKVSNSISRVCVAA